MGVIVDTQNAREKTIYVAKMLLKIKHFVNIKMHDEILRLSFKNANSEASMWDIATIQRFFLSLDSTVGPKSFVYQFLDTLDERGQVVPNEGDKRGGWKG